MDKKHYVSGSKWLPRLSLLFFFVLMYVLYFTNFFSYVRKILMNSMNNIFAFGISWTIFASSYFILIGYALYLNKEWKQLPDERSGFLRYLADASRGQLPIFIFWGVLFVFFINLTDMGTESNFMAPTVQSRDIIVSSTATYLLKQPDRGDIIIVEINKDLNKMHKMERIIGLPGETIEFTNEGQILVNDSELSEPYPISPNQIYRSSIKPIKLNSDQYFVIADQPTSKLAFGEVLNRTDFIGKAFLRTKPFSRFGFLPSVNYTTKFHRPKTSTSGWISKFQIEGWYLLIVIGIAVVVVLIYLLAAG